MMTRPASSPPSPYIYTLKAFKAFIFYIVEIVKPTALYWLYYDAYSVSLGHLRYVIWSRGCTTWVL